MKGMFPPVVLQLLHKLADTTDGEELRLDLLRRTDHLYLI